MGSKGIVSCIEKRCNIHYFVTGTNALPKRLGLVHKKPVLAPCKANLEKQEGFVLQYKESKRCLDQEDQIYFMGNT